MRNYLLLTVACALVAATPVAAREPRKPDSGKVPAQVQRLLGCRAIADSAQRLACFDRETAAVDQAVAKREIVVIDREQKRAATRSLFGFSVPDFGGIFGGDDKDAVKEIESTVVAARANGEGGYIVRLADGSTWTQVDDTPLGLPPEKGDKVLVRRGSFGTFYLRVSGQPGVKVKRIG